MSINLVDYTSKLAFLCDILKINKGYFIFDYEYSSVDFRYSISFINKWRDNYVIWRFRVND